MSTRTLLRLTPTAIIMAVMIYAAYSIHPSAPLPAQATATASPKPATTGERSGTPSNLVAPGRNPFLAVVKAPPEGQSKGLAGTHGGTADPYLALVQNLTLNATFIQGSTQYASINNRLYKQGQRIQGPDDELSSLALIQVAAAGVVLEADGQRYALAYPEQLTAQVRPAARRGGPVRSPAPARRPASVPRR